MLAPRLARGTTPLLGPLRMRLRLRPMMGCLPGGGQAAGARRMVASLAPQLRRAPLLGRPLPRPTPRAPARAKSTATPAAKPSPKEGAPELRRGTPLPPPLKPPAAATAKSYGRLSRYAHKLAHSNSWFAFVGRRLLWIRESRRLRLAVRALRAGILCFVIYSLGETHGMVRTTACKRALSLGCVPHTCGAVCSPR